MAFDPMTGEPIKENEDIHFDPMTGEPIGQQSQSTGGFDPMTGEPIGQQSQSTGGFDPMTGEPIGQQNQSTGGFDPMTGEPVTNSKKKKQSVPRIIAAAAVFVVAVAAVLMILSGVVFGKSGKVMLACANTVKDAPHFARTLRSLDILSGDKYTVAVSGDISNVNFSGEFRNSKNEKQMSVELNDSGETLEILAGIDTKAVRLQVPELSGNVVTYHYKGKNTGWLLDEADEDDIEMINTMLSNVMEKADTKDFYADLYRIFKDELKNIKFVNAEKEIYTINDKDVNCKGYTAVITGSSLARAAAKAEKLIEKKYAGLYALFVVDADDIGDTFDDLESELEDIDDIECTFYIYKNKLAAIVVDSRDIGGKVELCFEGGDYRMQNMVLKSGSYRLRLKGSDNGTKEQFTLETKSGSGSKSEIGSLEYNYENGRFLIDFSGLTVEGKLTGSKSELNLNISDIKELFFSMSPDLDITLKKGAKMEKYSGKEFDLGNADKSECMDFVEDIQDKIYDGDYGRLMRLLGINSLLY